MKRKTIGIPGYNSAKGDSFGAGINHLQFINHFGNVRIIMPWEGYVKVDMLYLPGGLDTQPARYGEVPGFTTSNQDVFKEFFFEKKLHRYLERDTPTFGVCLGSQMLATYYGGKLTQDLLFHPSSKERWQPAHTVFPIKQKDIVVEEKDELLPFDVNSHHHQALTKNGLSKQIIPIYKAVNHDDYLTGDGYIVEAFTVVNKPVFGVQWHPEELYDEFSVNLVNYLLTLSDV